MALNDDLKAQVQQAALDLIKNDERIRVPGQAVLDSFTRKFPDMDPAQVTNVFGFFASIIGGVATMGEGDDYGTAEDTLIKVAGIFASSGFLATELGS